MKNSVIFTSTVLATLPVRTAYQVDSFVAVSSLPKIIHSSGLSAMHTWGVF